MTLLLIALILVALIDLAALARWLRADSDGRPPTPPYAAFGPPPRS